MTSSTRRPERFASVAVGGAPAWSPDGARLAYARNGQVYVANADGGGEVGVGAGNAPSWSPDGGALAVSRPDGLGIAQIYVLHLSDGSATQLTFGTTSALLPAWSPDGATIVFDTQSTLYAVSPQGGGVRAIALPVQVNGGAAWAPDGARLAVVAANGQVWIANADGSGAHQVTYTLIGPEGSPERPAWSADGGQIAWTQGPDLCVTDPRGSVRRLTFTQQGQPFRGCASELAAGCAGDRRRERRPEQCDELRLESGRARRDVRQQRLVERGVAQGAAAARLREPHGKRADGDDDPAWGACDDRAGRVLRLRDGARELRLRRLRLSGRRAPTRDVRCRRRRQRDDRCARVDSLRRPHACSPATAKGPAGGAAIVEARPAGSSRFATIATVKPVGGRWHLSVAPRITTTYRIAFEGSVSDRLLRVSPALRVARSGATLRVSLAPAAPLAGSLVFLFRLRPNGAWAQFRTARVGRSGFAVLRGLPAGRYYVGIRRRRPLLEHRERAVHDPPLDFRIQSHDPADTPRARCRPLRPVRPRAPPEPAHSETEKEPAMAVASMRELLEAGVHFGHQTRRWNPKMRRFIFTERSGIYIIDLTQTSERLDEAAQFVRNLAERNGTVLFVGTKKQAQDAVESEAKRVTCRTSTIAGSAAC